MQTITKYITNKYGSVPAFLLLKYLLEHKLAREKKGFTTYELSFKIAPSLILTSKTLIKIERRADGTSQIEAEEGLKCLIDRKIIEIDPETDIVSLIAPLNEVANIYLKNKEQKLEQIDDFKEADAILLFTQVRAIAGGHISGVPDITLKNSKNGLTVMLLKFWECLK